VPERVCRFKSCLLLKRWLMMALKGQAWHDAREKAKRWRASLAECRAVAAQQNAEYEYNLLPKIEVDRDDAKEILSAARNFLDILSAALKE